MHNQLYQSRDFSRIELGEYTGSLAERLSAVYRAERPGIRTVLETEAVSITINDAVPIGLILNELITNAFKHAFPAPEGTIRIGIRSLEDEQCVVSVIDDGVGMPPADERTPGKTLGLILIEGLVRQLGARMEILPPRERHRSAHNLPDPLTVPVGSPRLGALVAAPAVLRHGPAGHPVALAGGDQVDPGCGQTVSPPPMHGPARLRPPGGQEPACIRPPPRGRRPSRQSIHWNGFRGCTGRRVRDGNN
ncbi:MAG: sensor histidine kinase [Spirochaetota bacterium]